MAAAFAKLQRLDFRRMRNKIRDITMEGQHQTLSQLIDRYPIEAGVVELLGYLQIAHDDGHRIDTNQTDTIIVHESRESSRIAVHVPHVTFIPKAMYQSAGKKPR